MPFLPYSQNQSYLFPPYLTDWIAEDHPARIFSDLIDRLGIAGFQEAEVEGRPRYDTRMMLKVLLWAYANGIRASRKIEDRLHSDVVFMWLSGRQTPDFHTICDFRRCHEAAIDRLFAEVIVLARALGMIRLGLIALDGTKIRASAGVGSFKTVKEWHKALREARQKVAEILAEAEAQDQADDRKYGPDHSGNELPEELMNAKERVARIEQILTQAGENAKESLRISSTDSQARFMHSQNGAIPAFNGQLAVTEDQMIVHAGVTAEPIDTNQLVPTLEGVKANTGAYPGAALADAGFDSGRNLHELEARQIDGYIPDGAEENIGKDLRNYPDLYGKNDFRYDTEHDCYWCPAGQALKRKTIQRSKSRYSEREAAVFKTQPGVCLNCPLRKKCTKVTTRTGRTITRGAYEAERERMKQKLDTEEGKAVYGKRKWLVEPTIGQLKVVGRLVQFLLRGLKGANLEFKWSAIAHNLLKLTRRVLVGDIELAWAG